MFTGKASDKAADKGKEEDGSRRRALIGNGVYGGRDVYDVCGSICVCAFYNVADYGLLLCCTPVRINMLFSLGLEQATPIEEACTASLPQAPHDLCPKGMHVHPSSEHGDLYTYCISN